jgi:hypothetical protein
MGKKFFTIILIILVIILIGGFFLFKNFNNNSGVENSLGGINTESLNNENESQNETVPQIQVEAEGQTGQGELLICVDECGNGICQEPDSDCGKDGIYNCICPENPEICPQDCDN